MAQIISGIPLVAGRAEGLVLASDEPLSFWGGFDHRSGEITDRRHPLSGQIASGRILLLPFTRGSSTTTAVLLESINAGTAPAAILTAARDPFLALASIVAKEMYNKNIPIIMINSEEFKELSSAIQVLIEKDGRIIVSD